MSAAFSLSPLMFAINWLMDTLNSSTLHAKYTHVALQNYKKFKWLLIARYVCMYTCIISFGW